MTTEWYESRGGRYEGARGWRAPQNRTRGPRSFRQGFRQGDAEAEGDADRVLIGAVASIIAGVTGRLVTHNDIDPDVWISGTVKAGIVPADYAAMLRWLTGTIIAGNGSRPNQDIEKVTRRPPTSFQDFARRKAAAWALQAAR